MTYIFFWKFPTLLPILQMRKSSRNQIEKIQFFNFGFHGLHYYKKEQEFEIHSIVPFLIFIYALFLSKNTSKFTASKMKILLPFFSDFQKHQLM